MSLRDSASYGSRRRLASPQPAESAAASRRDGQAMYQPGTPLGYLAARGTPYEKKYFTKKLGMCCLFIAPPLILIVLAITLVPVLGAIADHALHTAQFHIYSANLTDIGNASFPLSLQAEVKKTGIFPAHLYFRKPINVYWMTPPPNMREVHLGHFNLGFVGAAAGHARVKQLTTFNIDDQDGFAVFARFLVSQPEFTWYINCTEVHAEAFSFFPVYKPLPLRKNIVIKGIDNLHDLKLVDVQLPGDDPAGGITVSATASLINPSPFGIQVGTLALALYFKDLYLGPVQAVGVNLTAGRNLLTLTGRIVPYADNATALDILGELFTNYINSVSSTVIARGLSATRADGKVVTWLNDGITALTTTIPFLPPTPIDPIKGITIDYISLVYKEELPYNPDLFSNDLKGTIALPFGFSLNITQLATMLTIISDGATVGTAIGTFSDSTTDIQLLSSGQTAGDILLTLPPTQLVLPNTTDAAKRQLISFQNDFVYKGSAAFQAQGAARAITDTPVGKLLLDGIKFDVVTGLIGLSGLTAYPTVINAVDVTGGTSDTISLGVNLTLINPSNLNLSVGDTTLQLSNGVVLGNATLPDLILRPGRNDLASLAYFDPNRDPLGLETLNRFISGLSTNLNITGFDRSSPIETLAISLADLKINSTLPGLTSTLVQAANLTVLDSTGIVDNVANVIVQLANPFQSDLTITSISANASSHGVYLANIETALNFPAAGRATTASPTIPLTINLFPPDLFGLLRALAVDSNQDPALLDGLIQLAGYTITPTTSANSPASARKRDAVDEDESVLAQRLMGIGANAGVLDGLYDDEDDSDDSDEVETDGMALRAGTLDYAHITKRANIYTGFNLGTYVLQAFSVARSDLTIVSNAVIGDYGTTLTFSQNNVPLGTDDTLLKLLPPLALPIVQRIVDGAILNIDRVTITDPRPTSFTASLQGALTNAGPFDGVVDFPAGLDIFWQGQLLTQTAFPSITLTGDLGSSINVELEGQIPDVGYFTTFLEAAIRDPSFVWNIRGSGLRVSAIGIVVPNITINKDVQLTGLNSLRGQVIINSFDVPSNDPAGGLRLTAVSTINNPAQVGVSLSMFGVSISDGDVAIGPTAAESAFTLQALALTEVPLVGRLVEQTTDAGLAALSDIFTRFVHNQNTELVIQGQYAGPPDVQWLNDAIKVLTVTISLPSQDFQVIRLISLNQLSLFFTVPTAYDPSTDSSDTEAHFFLPFGFPLDISQITGPFTLNYNSADMALLNIPTSPAQTDVEARILTLMFTGIPLQVFDNSRTLFSSFVADFVRQQQVTFNLHGTATALANTAAGALTISDIPFDLDTNLLGLQNLNARPAVVSNLDVARGFPTYLLITVMTTLFNPSDTTVGAGDVSFSVLFQNNIIGNAVIRNILLVPGENAVPTEINYMPIGAANVASGQLLLENYVQNVTSDAVVQGNSQTTPIPSLLEGLSGITLSTSIPPLEKLIVVQARLVVPKDIAQTGVAQVNVAIANPFTASINIINLRADAIFQGITIGSIDQDLAATNNIIVAPGKVTTVSQQIPFNVNIDPKNLLRFILAAASTYGVSLGPLPPFFQQVLDLPSTVTTISPYPDDATPPCNSGRAFDTLGAVLALLRPLSTTIPIQSVLKLDEYQTALNFVQSPVPVATDETALYLIGPAAAPLIQLIVNSSVLTVAQANATSLTDAGFAVSLLGQLGVNTPADAYIEFPDGIIINFQGSDMATLTLTPLCASPPDGIPILTAQGQLTITNEAVFEEFAYTILTEPNFEWFLHTGTATVRTLGIKFSNVILEKTITLDAFDGIPGLVITRFSAPSDAPGRINIEADTPINSLASLGVQLDLASFELFFQGSDIGSITSDLLFLAPKATTLASFTGFLKDQSNDSEGLANIGILFSQYLAGQNSTLTIRGSSVVTRANNNQPVRWLTAAFRRFEDTVILPGMIYQIIFSITLSDLTVTIDNPADSYTVIGSNNYTLATFSNPFGFGLQPLQVAPLITLTYTGGDAAQINLPLTDVTAGTSRGPTDIQPLAFGFRDQDIVAIDRPTFQAFFAEVTNQQVANFGLRGNTTVVARTQIGDPTITDIPFNVSTSLAGINSFNGQAPLRDAQVNDPTPDYIGINLITTLENPSNITLFTNQISLPTYFTTNNALIGRATIPSLALFPGSNDVPTLFELMIPNNSSDVQELIQLYLQPADLTTEGQVNNLPLEIRGSVNANPELSPYDSLDLALAGVKLTSSLAGIGSRIVSKIRVYIPVNVLVQEIAILLGLAPPGTGVYVYAYLDAVNQLPSEIEFVRLTSSILDTTDPGAGEYARFELDFNSANAFLLPAAVTTGQPSVPSTTSPEVPNILLTKGLLASLALLGHNLNVINRIRLNLNGPNGTYFIPGLQYIENDIDTDYYLTGGSSGDNLGLPLDGVGSILDLLNLLTGDLLGDLIDGLSGLDPGNTVGIFQSIGGLGQVGEGIQGVLCTAGDLVGRVGQAACLTPAEASASAASASSLSAASLLSASAATAATIASITPLAATTAATAATVPTTAPAATSPIAVLPSVTL